MLAGAAERRVPEDIELLATARLLRDALPRFHPRFGFEERLARQLRGGGTAVLSLPVAVAVPLRPRDGDRCDAAASSRAAPARPPRPIPGAPRRSTGPHGASVTRASVGRVPARAVAGGAIASGVSLAIPIAGAAVVAWRRLRASGGLP